jgi:hypothetical protein
MKYGEIVRTGRTVVGRVDSTKARCPGCEARLMYGEPRPNATWPERLRLDDETASLLLVAAADFDEMTVESETAIGFVDWVVGVLRQSGHHVEADGAPNRSESGGFARHASYNHRHPFVLPQASLSKKVRV